MVLFNSYAFDLSGAANAPQKIRYSVRERYLWELLNPGRTDKDFADQPEQIRAELHDRLTAPLYPLAFMVIIFAYLGTPRTTRQGRAMSLVGAISAVLALRGLGFTGMIAGVHTPIALVLPYVGLIVTFALGYVVVSRGIIIEPPAFVTNAITAAMERITRHTPGLAGQSP
jgi:lipopolysaccharide export system permease protein